MAMTASGGDEGEVLSDINVTPLVDVMLVLLIIFIITVPVALKEIKVNLPKASNLPTQTKPEDVTIAVDKSGAIYWNTKQLANQDALLQELRAPRKFSRNPKSTSAATATRATCTWARFWWPLRRSASERWPSSPHRCTPAKPPRRF